MLENREAAEEKTRQVVLKLKEMKLGQVAEHIRQNTAETFSYFSFPSQHWRSIRTNNPLERVIKDVRRRTKVTGAFPNGNSALILVCARLRHVAIKSWGAKRYLDMDRLRAQPNETESSVSTTA